MPSIHAMSYSAHYVEGNATLGAGVTFKGPAHDACPGFARVRAAVYQDQAGAATGLQIEQSNDPTFAAAGTLVSAVAAVTASTVLTIPDVPIYRRYVRVSCNNSSGSPLTFQNIDLVFLYN